MIEVERLTKRYGALTAVHDLSFEVRPGEVLGLLGPNGSGKSTTVKMLTGLLDRPPAAFVLDGRDVLADLIWPTSQRSATCRKSRTSTPT